MRHLSKNQGNLPLYPRFYCPKFLWQTHRAKLILTAPSQLIVKRIHTSYSVKIGRLRRYRKVGNKFSKQRAQGGSCCRGPTFWHTSLCVCQKFGSQVQEIPKRSRRALFRVLRCSDRSARLCDRAGTTAGHTLEQRIAV